jgi:hypothetical protein
MQIQPVQVEIEKDTLPELQPVFNFMNVHSQKLYTEGYFLKLADLKPGRCTSTLLRPLERTSVILSTLCVAGNCN